MADVIITNPTINIPNNCIICLNNNPIIIQFNGSCNCKPYIHNQCLNQWLTNNNLTCPICRKKYKPPNDPNDNHRNCVGCCMCGFLIWILFLVILRWAGVLK